MKIEVNDELILFSTSEGSDYELTKDVVRIQIGEYTDNYTTININTLIRSLEAMRERE